MKILIVGATGATGKLLVRELLNRGQHVKAIVRTPENLPDFKQNKKNLSVIKASILDVSDADLMQYVEECDAVVSCLGHNMSLKGIYGKPRRLVKDTTVNLCRAIQANKSENATKYLLMNTAGSSNRDLNEVVSFGQSLLLSVIRLILPPHVDNEQAADYLRTKVGQNDKHIEWSVIRPDTLLEEKEVTDYKVHPSPTRSAIFNAGKTSRINVSSFMADLITDETIWNNWQGKMPVIYNKEDHVD